MPLFGSAKQDAALAGTAETIGGRVGWPTESWLKGKRMLMFSPLNQMGSKSAPISGTVAGRTWASFRVRSKASRSVGLGTETTSLLHTGVFVSGIGTGLPVFNVVARQGSWASRGFGKKYGFPSGDAAFDQSVLVSASPEIRPRVAALLTSGVKAALEEVMRADQSTLVRVAGGEGMLMCWIDGEDARDSHFPPLLQALAHLADALNAASVTAG
jgi:hypothetical protein